jgi:ribosomal-protein-alanine N-acetyltransferase
MAPFFRYRTERMDGLPELRTGRTVIRLLREHEASLLLDYRIANRAHLAPWEPLHEDRHFTLDGCRRSVVEGIAAARAGRGWPFAVLAPDQRAMLAGFSLSNVVRGAFQACHLGYSVAAAHQGRGLMHEALQCGLDCAFGRLGLHRVMAAYLPRNARSARLLARLGFEREGYARAYLRIAGVWEDHVLTARVAPDRPPASPQVGSGRRP